MTTWLAHFSLDFWLVKGAVDTLSIGGMVRGGLVHDTVEEHFESHLVFFFWVLLSNLNKNVDGLLILAEGFLAGLEMFLSRRLIS